MNPESLGSGRVRMAVAVLLLLAVVSSAYLAFADRTVEISNAEELQQVRENPSGNYILTDDIDLSHVDNFEPIEDFTGTFDGNSHTISNLTIDRQETYGVGLFGNVADKTRLFGFVGSEGKVRDVTLKDVNVAGSEGVGGLAGSNRGIVTKSGVDGDLKGSSEVGGLIGVNRGSVSQSYAVGSVSSKQLTGGLVGVNFATVTESYARNKVSGESYVGSLVGRNVAAPEWENTVASSYATGNVTGDEDVGGLVGLMTVGNITASYWDVNSTGQNESDGGTPLTTKEMTGSSARENMDGFDFEETWRTVTHPDDYPRLSWQDDIREDGGAAETGSEDGTVTESEPEDSTATEAVSEGITTTDLVSVSGLIFKNRTVRSLEWYYLENRTDETDPQGDDFTLRGVDGDGDVISSQSFDAPFRAYVSPSEESPIETNVTGYSLVEEYPLDLAKFRLAENDTTIAEFNPNVELLRTAAESVPRDGFKRQDSAEGQREALLDKIDALENMLEAGDDRGAVPKMEDDILPSLEEWLRDGYETEYVTQMTKDEVLTTAEAVTERLRTQAGD